MTEKSPIRVIIVDDHDRVRSVLGLVMKVAEDLEVVGEARDGEEAVALCAEIVPDVVLMDLLMPKMSGVAAIQRIRQQHPEMGIVALTGFESEELKRRALHAGATTYLEKDCSASELLDTIRATHAGKFT